MTVLERIDRAIERLKTRGWIQGNYISDSGYCIYGALLNNPSPTLIQSVYQTIEESLQEDNQINEIGRAAGFESGVAFGRWNDNAGRTKDQVLHRLEQARIQLSGEKQ